MSLLELISTGNSDVQYPRKKLAPLVEVQVDSAAREEDMMAFPSRSWSVMCREILGRGLGSTELTILEIIECKAWSQKMSEV